MHRGVYNFMDVNKIKELIPTTKVKELPQNTVIKVEIDHEHGYYEIEVNTKYDTHITVNSSWATVKLDDPDPETSIEEVVKDALAFIEKYRTKKTTET